MSIIQQAEGLAKSVHRALRDDLGVQDVLGGVNDDEPRLYDTAPEDPIYPYLTYGTMRSQDIGADETVLAAHQMTLHVWSRYAGRAEVFSLLSRISGALSAQSLTQAGLLAVHSANVLYSDVLRAPDGRTHHGLLRLSFTTEPNGDAL